MKFVYPRKTVLFWECVSPDETISDHMWDRHQQNQIIITVFAIFYPADYRIAYTICLAYFLRTVQSSLVCQADLAFL